MMKTVAQVAMLRKQGKGGGGGGGGESYGDGERYGDGESYGNGERRQRRPPRATVRTICCAILAYAFWPA